MRKKKVYKDALTYSPNAKDPKYYHRVGGNVRRRKTISKIAKELISQDRQFIELSMIRDHLDKWLLMQIRASHSVLKTHIIIEMIF